MHLWRFITVFDDLARMQLAGVPILVFHKLGFWPRRTNMPGMYVSPGAFVRQCQALQGKGFRSLNLDQTRDSGEVHGKSFILTFDDGFASVLQHGVQPLQKSGFRAIQFLVADRLGRVNEWDIGVDRTPEKLMDEYQVRDWLALGHEIGAHTLTHPRLADLTPGQAGEEISGSRKKLEDKFQICVRHFAYPYGSYNKQTVELVREAGFDTAVTMDPGVAVGDGDPWVLPRLNVTEKRIPRLLVDKTKRWLKGWRRVK